MKSRTCVCSDSTFRALNSGGRRNPDLFLISLSKLPLLLLHNVMLAINVFKKILLQVPILKTKCGKYTLVQESFSFKDEWKKLLMLYEISLAYLKIFNTH